MVGSRREGKLDGKRDAFIDGLLDLRSRILLGMVIAQRIGQALKIRAPKGVVLKAGGGGAKIEIEINEKETALSR
jgi:hypothetical protein